jgi:hypothetical protein
MTFGKGLYQDHDMLGMVRMMESHVVISLEGRLSVQGILAQSYIEVDGGLS